MQENEQDASRTHEANHKEEHGEKRSLQGAPVGKLIEHQLLGNIPPQEQACYQRAYRHEQLGREVVAIGKEVLAEEA